MPERVASLRDASMTLDRSLRTISLGSLERTCSEIVASFGDIVLDQCLRAAGLPCQGVTVEDLPPLPSVGIGRAILTDDVTVWLHACRRPTEQTVRRVRTNPRLPASDRRPVLMLLAFHGSLRDMDASDNGVCVVGRSVFAQRLRAIICTDRPLVSHRVEMT